MSRLSLGARIFIATALLVTLTVAVAVAVTFLYGNQVGEREAQKELERSSEVQRNFEQYRLDQLYNGATLFSGDPEWTAYMAEAIASGDSFSALDQLEERQRDLGFDFSMVLDRNGVVVARTDSAQAAGNDLSQQPLVASTIADFGAEGRMLHEGALYEAVGVAFDTGGVLAGYLVTAYIVDDETALSLRRVGGVDVAYIDTLGEAAPRILATSIDSRGAAELADALRANPTVIEADTAADTELSFSDDRWFIHSRPLTDAGGEVFGALLTLASLDEQLAPFRRIVRLLILVGLVALLAALAISFLLPKRLLQPLRELAVAARGAAEGNYDQEIAHIDRGDEVGALGGAFDTLLADLREKRDMEIYISELSRNLPDQVEGGSLEAVPAQARELTLLGVELRSYSEHALDSRLAAHENLERMAQDLRRVSRSVQSQAGKTEALLGHRLIASFEGSRRSQRALSAAAEILVDAGTRPGLESTSAALVSGSALTGTITWSDRPRYTVTGWPMEHLEALLRVVKPGSLLLSKSARDELGTTFETAAVELREHRSSVSPLPLFSLSRQAVSRLAHPSLTATQELTGADVPVAHHTLSEISPGQLLGNRFEILSTLGAGGMGVVYKARDRTLDELVALKMLKQEMWGDDKRLERLKEELKLARKIAHPNVLRTYDFGETDGVPFISMEFVRGVTLRQLLDQSGRLPLSAGLRIARQVGRGLQAAHAQAVLHRDIKPENLLIEHTGNAKLMDFGIAQTIRRGAIRDQDAVLVGTPFYLAPEQIEGREPDERADLYATGVVLYEIFTNRLPFDARGTMIQVVQRKLREEPTPPTEHWPGMPSDLQRIILRCLERDPAARYDSIESLLADLEHLRA